MAGIGKLNAPIFFEFRTSVKLLSVRKWVAFALENTQVDIGTTYVGVTTNLFRKI